MELKVVEEKDESLSLKIVGETHTFLNLLTEKTWKEGALQAAYFLEHPYLANPRIKVKGKNPRKILKDSAQKIIDECQEFSTAFKRGMKK